MCCLLETRNVWHGMYTIKVFERSKMFFFMNTFSWMHLQFEVFFFLIVNYSPLSTGLQAIDYALSPNLSALIPVLTYELFLCKM